MVSGRYVENYKNYRKFSRQREMKDFLKPVAKDSWEESVYQVSPHYDKFTNTITIPVAILQPPFFWPNPKSIAFGGLGTIAGKLI